jgi:hypothetical protein
MLKKSMNFPPGFQLMGKTDTVLDAWGRPSEENAYNQALKDADEVMALYLGPTHKARVEVAKLRKI